MLMCDNLLGLAHVKWVCRSNFTFEETKDTPLLIEKADDGVIVTVELWMTTCVDLPKVVESEGNCERLQHYEVQLAFEEDRAVPNAVQIEISN